jgi:mannose-6-phosphate isomerase-like protein (cupin superfamily)
MHRDSEEYYILLQGELRFAVAGAAIALRAGEILMVRPGVRHAIVGGRGRIEHFGLRAPALEDKQSVGELQRAFVPATEERRRELRETWGCRIPLETAENQNCWLIGAGKARFQSSHLILAYLNFRTTEAANAGIGTRHRLHFHQKSWEYYVVLKGKKSLRIEDERVTLEAGEILEVPPQVRHTLRGRRAPYEGFTLRVPVELDDKVVCPSSSAKRDPVGLA